MGDGASRRRTQNAIDCEADVLTPQVPQVQKKIIRHM